MKKHQKGFTLIEIAIVMVITGLMVSMMAEGFTSVIQRQRLTQTNTYIEQIREALSDYVALNGRLPCPADPSIAPGMAGYGREAGADCAAVPTAEVAQVDGRIDPVTTVALKIRVGAVPVLTLGLPFEAISDGFGNRFTYAVTESLTSSTTFAASQGAIEIVDSTGTSMLTTPGTGLYTVLSHGRDGRGAYNELGNLHGSACGDDDGLDTENCDGDGVFRTGLFSSATGNQHFDDFVEFSETMLGGAATATNTGPTCPPGIAGIPGVDAAGAPTCLSPGGHFFEVCGLSVIARPNTSVAGRMGSISPCNGTFINSTGADACPDGFGLLDFSPLLEIPAFGVDPITLLGKPTAKFYTCIPLGNDGFRFFDNTFIPNGKTASCSGRWGSTPVTLTAELRVEDGRIRAEVEGVSDIHGPYCHGLGFNTVPCVPPQTGSGPISTSTRPGAIATINGLKLVEGLHVANNPSFPPVCTAEWE